MSTETTSNTKATGEKCPECKEYHYNMKPCQVCGEAPHMSIQTREEHQEMHSEAYRYYKEKAERTARRLKDRINELEEELRLKKQELAAHTIPTREQFEKLNSYDEWVRQNRERALQEGFYFVENEDSKQVAE